MWLEVIDHTFWFQVGPSLFWDISWLTDVCVHLSYSPCLWASSLGLSLVLQCWHMSCFRHYKSWSPSSWGGGGNLRFVQGNGVFFGAFFHLLPFLCSRGKAGASQFDGSISAPPDRHYLQMPVIKMQQSTCFILCNRTPAICCDFIEKNDEIVSGRALEVETVHAG